MNKNLLLLLSIVLNYETNVHADLTPEEQCWGTLAKFQHPNDVENDKTPENEKLFTAINSLVQSIKKTEQRGVTPNSAIHRTFRAIDLLLAEVPWNKRGHSGNEFPAPMYQADDKYNWQLVLGRLSFLTINDWNKHCATSLQTDGICPTEDHKGVNTWVYLYNAIHDIRKVESGMNDLSKLETFRRICNDMVDEWDKFQGINHGVEKYQKPEGCGGVDDASEYQRAFCTLFLPKLKQVLVMQLCHYA